MSSIAGLAAGAPGARGLCAGSTLRRRIGAALRSPQSGVAVILVRFEHVPQLEAALGRARVRSLVRDVAARVRKTARPQDAVGTLGTDELAIVAHDCDLAEARMLVRRLAAAVAAGSQDEGSRRNMRLSTDVAGGWTQERGVGSQALLATARERARQVRDGLDDGIGVVDGRPATDPRSVARSLVRACLEDGLALVAQPIVDVATGRRVAEELLVRLPASGGRLLAPADFLPAAESLGLMAEIDSFVMRRALEWLEMPDRGDVALHVNVSGASLSDAGFLQDVMDATDGDRDLSKLVVEITETAPIRRPDVARRAIGLLRAGGARLAVDDFGAGFASFAYLRQFEPELVKLDQGLVSPLRDDVRQRDVVRSIVDAAHALGATIVAEGVEDAETLELVRAAGVEQAQGFGIGRPRRWLAPTGTAAAPDATGAPAQVSALV